MRRRAVHIWLGAALIAGCLAGLWSWLYPGQSSPRAARPALAPARHEGGAAVSTKHARTRAQLQLLAQLARAAQQAAAEPPRLPHPITDDHRRLYRDVDLLHAAEEAIEQERFDQARQLLLTHQHELPGMSPLEAEGLWLLVDCVERPSAGHTARVQAFYDQHTASTVRRRLRRSCLERGR